MGCASKSIRSAGSTSFLHHGQSDLGGGASDEARELAGDERDEMGESSSRDVGCAHFEDNVAREELEVESIGISGGTLNPGEGFLGLGISISIGTLKPMCGSGSSDDPFVFLTLPFLVLDLVSWERLSGVAAERALELGAPEKELFFEYDMLALARLEGF